MPHHRVEEVSTESAIGKQKFNASLTNFDFSNLLQAMGTHCAKHRDLQQTVLKEEFFLNIRGTPTADEYF
jgi:hypothetical protein